MSSPLVQLEQVSLQFGQLSPILKTINFTVNEGQHTLITGASGSGKTSLLHIMAGLTTCFKGRAHLLGQDVQTISDHKMSLLRREDIGFVYQFHHLLSEFNVVENVALPLMFNGVSRHQSISSAKDLMIQIGLSPQLFHQHVRALSGGERQRVALARAVVHRPTIVFADEPTGCLDQSSSQQLLTALFELQKHNQTTFILVSHDPSIRSYFKHQIHLEDSVIKNNTK